GTAGFGIPVGAYDTTRDLVIDPTVSLVFAGYIGGVDADRATDIALDAAGDMYITGFAASSAAEGFPATPGPYVPTNAGGGFVAKVRGRDAALVYVSYIGPAGGRSIAVDAAGAAYVTGSTRFAQDTFPVVTGPDPTYNGGQDAFVTKLDPTGTALVYSGYIGGAASETGASIAVDGAGNAYVGGSTDSTEATFPVKVGPDVTYNGGIFDAFVAKVDATGNSLAYAGYVGGAGLDSGNGIAVDGAGNAYLTGSTDSAETSGFPVAVGPDLTFNVSTTGHNPRPGSDAYVAKVDATGAALAYAGYIGGTGFDAGHDVAVDATGNAYVIGDTASHTNSFPASRGSFDHTFGGGFFADGFLAKVNPEGTALVYAGYIGSDTLDSAVGVTVDAAGSAYVVGFVGITKKFPTPGGFDTTHNGRVDAFVVKVNPAGTAFEWGTLLGGSGADGATGVAVDSAGAVYIAGDTDSAQDSFPVVGGPDLSYNGGGDAFVAKLSQSP
ncbi:MAG: SBBP repeat-containing protein, partial [Actinobacteria bacterium]|nr:SBBP repeat-containing protein [Actinomycetota bacterium]